MAGWLTGLVWLALSAAPQPVDLTWVPAPSVGLRLPALAAQPTDRALVRKPWCNFGRHAQRWAKGSTTPDVVFRRPSTEARAALQEIHEAVLNPTDYTSRDAAEARFQKLVQTVDGPALIRITLQDTDTRMQLMSLRAAKLIVARQPRLAAFATGYLGSPEPELAIAATEMHFASGCDTAVLYALDSFRHPDENVQLALLHLILQASQERENLRLAERIGSFIAEGKGTPRTRVIALRLLGRLGVEAATTDVERMLNDKQDAVAAEALATLAILQPGAVEKRIGKWWKDKSPHKRAAAMRAFAQVYPTRLDLAEKQLRPMVNDTTPLPDAFGVAMGPGKTLGDLARAALSYVQME